jgi:hypothetical protein
MRISSPFMIATTLAGAVSAAELAVLQLQNVMGY